MILKTLSPVSFGRFQDREFPLEPGVNLIEAPNEAGKSTLAAFVSGMLYGFYRRDAKKRLYAPAFDRYQPWDNPGRYFGSLTLLHEGEAYRLERDFLKDEVKLYEATTGRDVTDRMPGNQSLRVREPGQFFLKISQTAFEGTLYVPQQAVRAGDALGAELADRIDALSETGSGGLSASGAVRWLIREREALGTPRRGGTPLGEQTRKLSELNEERQGATERRARAAADGARARELAREIAALEEEQKFGEAALEQARRFVRWKRAETAKSYRARVQELTEALNALPNGGADESLIEKAIQESRLLSEHVARAEDVSRALQELDGQIEEARAEADATGLTDETCALSDALERSDLRAAMLESDLAARREAEYAARRALPASPAVPPQRALELMTKYETLPPLRPARGLSAAGGVLTALALLGLLSPAAFLLAVPGIVLLALGLYQNRKYWKGTAERAAILEELRAASPEDFPALRAALEDRARAERALEAASAAAEQAKAALQNALSEREALLANAGFDAIDGYRDALKRYEAARGMDRAHRIRRSALLEQREALDGQISARTSVVSLALAAAGLGEQPDAAAATEALTAHLAQLRARRETARALDDAKRLLRECLGADDYEALVASAVPTPEPDESPDALADAVNGRAARIQALRQEMAACAARRDAIEDACRTVAEIDEEIQLAQEKLDELTRRAEALDAAKARIERAADDMRRKLSPALSRAIASVSGRVTLGRYAELQIDTDLTVQARAFGRTVSPDRLSGGAADAIYLALRLGLIEFLMGDRPCPVILDDSFAQLDDDRAARMLEVVADFASTRQALILTCQSRTRRMLEARQIPHHAVSL